eukprot:4682758-Pleurochrysis_carterae.AAC.1
MLEHAGACSEHARRDGWQLRSTCSVALQCRVPVAHAQQSERPEGAANSREQRRRSSENDRAQLMELVRPGRLRRR